ncbi:MULTISPECIES: DNA-3-methyladenine glycosylase family protein [unclassified Nocardioides]|uniref:DNA-3-methyladenine glycosylase family protein n=1 Tax=unclassified Nocardioides TaxID=2615069 RepID=UPI00360CF9A7
MDGQVREWRPDWPCPVSVVLAVHRRGGGDPTYRVDGERHWRGIRTPEGPATLAVEPRSGEGLVRAEAWGPGADWVLGSIPALLGADDDVAGFEPRHPIVEEGWRRYNHWRIGRTGLVMEALTPAIIEQKVTGQEAFAGFRMLVHRYGERAPGPGADLRLWVQPDAETIRRIPSWEWLRMHVDPARSRALVTAARVADALERTAGLPGEEVERRLTTLPGIGVWTAAEVRQRAHGDADAVSFGDYHVAPDVGWAVAGRPFDDDELAEFLEPWRPHRGRVPVLIGLTAGRRPRRGPRMAPRTHLPARVTRR